jgi:hypothetical protein
MGLNNIDVKFEIMQRVYYGEKGYGVEVHETTFPIYTGKHFSKM